MHHFADRVSEAVRYKGTPLCVGLDPRWESLPEEIRRRHGSTSLESVAAAFEEFCSRVIDRVADLVPIVKPQSAFFEACGPAGLVALRNILHRARRRGLLTLLDGKRNDIASTATAYADAALAGVTFAGHRFPVWEADALTVNPYLGRDAVEPFLQSARRCGGGVFVLVRTSNAGAGQFQDLVVTRSGGTEPGRPLFLHVAEAVRAWARENLGSCGLGDVGAVVGATYPAELALLRKELPEVLFLVPGFGAQGGKAEDVMAAFRPDGLGALVNSSRAILFPGDPADPAWEQHVEKATRDAVAALPRVPHHP
ncbi:MAG: orotidine-5'-phosphate decarboxylase [Planctomycetes bacterium]|nr:orotidine-5'-phosphate decarboxylase [Planctomycetota bacterium]